MAIAIGAALLPALAFGGISAGRSALYFTVADEFQKEQAAKKAVVAHTPAEPRAGAKVTLASVSEPISRGFAARFA